MKPTAWLLLAVVWPALPTDTVLSQTPPSAERALRLWADASAEIPAPGKSARQRALYRHRSDHSGHEIALILEFLGPVDADDLLQRYRFTGIEQAGGGIRLTAVPRDSVERLFYRQWEIVLDARTHLPVSLTFSGRNDRSPGEPVALFSDRQRALIAAANVTKETHVTDNVQLASAESPAENRVVQAAASTTSAWPQDVQRRAARMPALYGMHWKSTAAALRDLGYTVRFRRGKPAERPEQVYCIAEQSPAPGALLSEETTVVLTLFDKRAD